MTARVKASTVMRTFEERVILKAHQEQTVVLELQVEQNNKRLLPYPSLAYFVPRCVRRASRDDVFILVFFFFFILGAWLQSGGGWVIPFRSCLTDLHARFLVGCCMDSIPGRSAPPVCVLWRKE